MSFALRSSWAGTTRRMIALGFGGPYVPGTTTDVGAAIVYSLVFWALLLVGAGRMSVGRLMAARIPARRRTSG